MFEGLAPIGWEFLLYPFSVDTSIRKNSDSCKIFVFKNVVRIAIKKSWNLKCGTIIKELHSSKKIMCSKHLGFNINNYYVDSTENLRWIELCFYYREYSYSDMEEAPTGIIKDFLNDISESIEDDKADWFKKYISIVSNIISCLNNEGYYFDKVVDYKKMYSLPGIICNFKSQEVVENQQLKNILELIHYGFSNGETEFDQFCEDLKQKQFVTYDEIRDYPIDILYYVLSYINNNGMNNVDLLDYMKEINSSRIEIKLSVPNKNVLLILDERLLQGNQSSEINFNGKTFFMIPKKRNFERTFLDKNYVLLDKEVQIDQVIVRFTNLMVDLSQINYEFIICIYSN